MGVFSLCVIIGIYMDIPQSEVWLKLFAVWYVFVNLDPTKPSGAIESHGMHTYLT